MKSVQKPFSRDRLVAKMAAECDAFAFHLTQSSVFPGIGVHGAALNDYLCRAASGRESMLPECSRRFRRSKRISESQMRFLHEDTPCRR